MELDTVGLLSFPSVGGTLNDIRHPDQTELEDDASGVHAGILQNVVYQIHELLAVLVQLLVEGGQLFSRIRALGDEFRETHDGVQVRANGVSQVVEELLLMLGALSNAGCNAQFHLVLLLTVNEHNNSRYLFGVSFMYGVANL